MSENKQLNALKNGQKLHWYQIRDILGQGGFGITYLAQDLNLGHEVAIKEYLPVNLAIRAQSGSVSPVADEYHEQYYWGLERFLDEARTLGQFKHPNIVQMRNVFEANNTAYMVMEYELGETFQDVLSRRKQISEQALKAIIFPIINGIKAVHAVDFIHRDIKPANIFLRIDGDPVLLDFGAARKSLGQEHQSLINIFSHGYTPIEQYTSNGGAQGAWTDIYSLGATMYRAISGRVPIDAINRSESIAQINFDNYVSITELADDDYSVDLLQGIDSALQFHPQDRPQTMAEWATTFDRRDVNSRISFNNNHAVIEKRTLAAETGDAHAQAKLAFMYAKGISTEKNEEIALKWYREAAENNHVESQYNLALMYAKGRGVEQDYHEALKWYQLAAEQDDERSQCALAMMYAKGIGTEKDNELAYHWFMAAAEQGNTYAEFNVAERLNKAIGVKKDLNTAYKWYEKAAMKNHILAQMKLAYMYGKGHGVKRNNTEAFHWFRKAAEQGHPKAQYNLGVIYATGRGITKDMDEATKWYTLAAAQGDKNAEKALSHGLLET